jgi:hypothetical protein
MSRQTCGEGEIKGGRRDTSIFPSIVVAMRGVLPRQTVASLARFKAWRVCKSTERSQRRMEDTQVFRKTLAYVPVA